MKLFVASSVCLCTILVNGCVSGVTAKKVTQDNNPKGLRVHLPAPFLVGRPNPAGEIAWDIEYLPDPDQEYAIHAWQILSKNNSAFIRTRSGLLTSATLKLDSTTIAAQLAESAGSLTSKVIEDSAAAADAAKAAAKASATEEAEKQQAVKQNQLAVEQARQEAQRAAAALQEANNAVRKLEDEILAEGETADRTARLEAAKDTRNEAQVASDAANLAFRRAELALDAAKRSLEITRGNFDAPGAPAENANVKAPSPVVYRIVEDSRTQSIKLEQVRFEVFSFEGNRVSGPSSQVDVSTWGEKKDD